MAKLVTNQEEFLSEVIHNILPGSKNLFFLVGYFYFSGFEEIYQQVEHKDMKILVGMNIERDLSNNIKEFYVLQKLNQSRLQIRKNYYESFIDLFNETDYFDSEERIKAFKIFLKKIEEGTLEIRQTVIQNHAKLYLFQHEEEHSQGGNLPGTMITGSSNLTLSGLRNRQEINVILYDEFEKGKQLFDELWETAIEIVNDKILPDFEQEIIEKIWYNKLYKPYLFYARVLLEYFSINDDKKIKFPKAITDGKFFDLKYQKDAIKKALHIIEEHKGVIISDVVGLGKSIVASAIAYNLRQKVIIIAPPHLRDQWDKEYRTLFNLNAVVFGSGSIDKALRQQREVWDNEEILIIVDEAHKFRNEKTDDYLKLHQLCQGNKVLLLTATPFNNRPQDIFAMIKLFQIPSRSTIRTVDNLSYRFTQLIKEFTQLNKKRRNKTITPTQQKKEVDAIARKIRFILEPILIRRSRIDLDKIKIYKEDLEKQNIKYVFAEPPILQEYSLGSLAALYTETLEKLANRGEETFIGARYKPADYINDLDKFKKNISNENADVDSIKIAQINLADLMRRLLVGRFESSVNAFKKTIESMIDSMLTIRKYHDILTKVPIYKKGKLPSPDLIYDDLDDDTKADIENYNFEEELKKEYAKGLVFIDKADLSGKYINDLNHDIGLLQDIHKLWFENGISADPKLKSFQKEISQQLQNDPQRKIVVFSEYTDTARYIFDNIQKSKIIKPIYYSSSESNKVRRTIKANFDASATKQADDYNIIITTDALSEGINLNRAGTIFNYDIPYNPTRVIQRVGRINRIGKMLFDKLYIYNYFPTEIGEDQIKRKEISTLKKTMIDTLLGEDTKVLTDEEQLKSYFHEQYNQALANQESESWDVEFQNQYLDILHHQPGILAKAQKIEHRSRLRRSQLKSRSGVLIFGKKGEDFTFRLGSDATNSEAITAEEALSLFQAELSENPQAVSIEYDAIYQNAKENLYLQKTLNPQKGRRAKTLNKLKALKTIASFEKDYLQDLYTVATELNSLPDGVFTMIDKIHSANLREDIKNLKIAVPHSYLDTIIKKAQKIEEGAETLILSEELI